MKKLLLVASVADAGSRVIVPATNSKNPAPAVNVDVASTLGHNAIPTDAVTPAPEPHAAPRPY